MSKNFELMRMASNRHRSVDAPDEMAEVVERPSPKHESAKSALSYKVGEQRRDPWVHAVSVLKQQWRLSALFSGVVILSVTTVTLLMKPVYEPSATIEIDPPGAEIFTLEGNRGSSNDAQYLETQAKNLQSVELAIAVIRSLHLDSNRDLVALGKRQQNESAPSESAIGLTRDENSTLASFRDQLTVKRDTGSHLITVSFASHDPRLAATVTNTLLDLFIERTYKTRHEAIMQSTEWLSRQLDDLRARMQESNRALAEFQKVAGVADVDENSNTFTQQMAELNRQHTLAQADRIQLQSFLNKNQNPELLPQVRNNPLIQALTQKLADVHTQLAEATVIYGKNHPNIKRLQNEADELQTQIKTQEKAITGELQISYAAARAREQLISSEKRGTTKELNQMAQYNAIKKEAQANANLYNSLYTRVKEAGIAAASKSSNIRIIDRARVLENPTRPRRLLNIGLGILAGILGGITFAFMRQAMDRTVRSPEEIKGWLGFSAISVLPVIGAGKNNGAGKLPTRTLWALAGGASQNGTAEKFILERPLSPEAEALRGLHTSIMLSRAEKPPQVLLLASSFPGEGKTTVAVNLAIALSQHGSTCLLDADMRRAAVANTFHLHSDLGLRDLLAGRASLNEVLVDIPKVPNLSVLAGGSGSSNPIELSCSKPMKQIIMSLRQRFDFVVIDTPPILPYADGRALSPLVDGIIFVGRSGVTTREAMVRSLELLAEVRSAPILEIVLNAADYTSPEYRYYRDAYDRTS